MTTQVTIEYTDGKVRRREIMTTQVTIEYTDGEVRKATISFGDQTIGFDLCCESDRAKLITMDDDELKLRLLGAAFINALEQVVMSSERSARARLANLAKTQIELGCMLGVKALHKK